MEANSRGEHASNPQVQTEGFLSSGHPDTADGGSGAPQHVILQDNLPFPGGTDTDSYTVWCQMDRPLEKSESSGGERVLGMGVAEGEGGADSAAMSFSF